MEIMVIKVSLFRCYMKSLDRGPPPIQLTAPKGGMAGNGFFQKSPPLSFFKIFRRLGKGIIVYSRSSVNLENEEIITHSSAKPFYE